MLEHNEKEESTIEEKTDVQKIIDIEESAKSKLATQKGATIYFLLLLSSMSNKEICNLLGSNRNVGSYMKSFEDADFIEYDVKATLENHVKSIKKDCDVTATKNKFKLMLEEKREIILKKGERLKVKKHFFRATLKPFFMRLNSSNIANVVVGSRIHEMKYFNMDDVRHIREDAIKSGWKAPLSKEEEDRLTCLWNERKKSINIIPDRDAIIKQYAEMNTPIPVFKLLIGYFIDCVKGDLLKNNAARDNTENMPDESDDMERIIAEREVERKKMTKILILLQSMNYSRMTALRNKLIAKKVAENPPEI